MFRSGRQNFEEIIKLELKECKQDLKTCRIFATDNKLLIFLSFQLPTMHQRPPCKSCCINTF